MMLTLVFRLKMNSGYHVGAGYGRGFLVDSALLRGPDALPTIPGTTLTGLFRASVGKLLKLSPLKSQGHDPEDTLRWLFGSAQAAKPWRFSSAKLLPVKGAKDAGETVHRVRIDPKKRRAEDLKLFSHEQGRAGSEFQFEITTDMCDAASLDEGALLVAGARLIRNIGRSRRRGLGECSITLVGVKGPASENAENVGQAWFLERFKTSWLLGKPSDKRPTAFSFKTERSPVQPPPDALQSDVESNREIVRLRVIAHLEEPAILAARGLSGNQYYSLPYIPGSVLLGAFAGTATRLGRLSYEEFLSLFLRGSVLFPALYPAYYHADRIFPTIPTPQPLQVCSIYPPEGYNQGHGFQLGWDGALSCSVPGCQGRLEQVHEFAVLRRFPPHTFAPSQSSRMHIAVDELTGRVKKGQLYSYTSTDPGQYFVGELVCMGERSWEKLRAALGIEEGRLFPCWLGKARTRGYGKVSLRFVRLEEEPPVWIQVDIKDRVRREKDGSCHLTMTLLTDTILRNAWGQYSVGFTPEELRDILGQNGVLIDDVFCRTRMVEGFNAHLGLPRWRETAVAAGSVVRFRLPSFSGSLLSSLQRIEMIGIGLRRNEGFGRVAFNHPLYKGYEVFRTSSIPLVSGEQAPHVDEDTFASGWERELDTVLKNVGTLDGKYSALARWLHSNYLKTPEELIHGLKSFGSPEGTLLKLIEDYGRRDKPNAFGDGDVVAMCLVAKALKALMCTPSRDWPLGVRILAQRLADLVEK